MYQHGGLYRQLCHLDDDGKLSIVQISILIVLCSIDIAISISAAAADHQLSRVLEYSKLYYSVIELEYTFSTQFLYQCGRARNVERNPLSSPQENVCHHHEDVVARRRDAAAWPSAPTRAGMRGFLAHSVSRV